MRNHTIVDRRDDPKGHSDPDRRRFIARNKNAIRRAIKRDLQGDTGITDIAKRKKHEVRARNRGSVHEPEFRHARDGGRREKALPGNKKFVPGDKIKRPDGGAGGGSASAPDGDGMDDFVFEITREEYFDILFEDLELPNFIKRALSGEEEFRYRRAGFTREGPPSKIDIVRSHKRSIMRRQAFTLPKERRKRELEEELERIQKEIADAEAQGKKVGKRKKRAEEISKEIEELERKIRNVPFMDDVDLEYRRHEKEPLPIRKAVVFFILDASASMDEMKKELAKRFMLLLYEFLRRAYEHVDIVFIRHTQDAEEVDEETFFYSQETGGTIVSSALALMAKIIQGRYAISEWNIYGCHTTDGDDYSNDVAFATNALAEDILPLVQYYAYVETRDDDDDESNLWESFCELDEEVEHFVMTHVQTIEDIPAVFRGLFRKKGEGND